MKILLFPCIIFFGLLIGLAIPEAHGQSLERQVVASAGTTLQNNALSLDFTMGEMMTSTLVEGEALCQGFQQVWAVITANEEPGQELSVRLYPNPTPGFLHVVSDEPLVLTLLDIKGSFLLEEQIPSGATDMDISALAEGTYVVHLLDPKHKTSKTYKLIKLL